MPYFGAVVIYSLVYWVDQFFVLDILLLDSSRYPLNVLLLLDALVCKFNLSYFGVLHLISGLSRRFTAHL